VVQNVNSSSPLQKRNHFKHSVVVSSEQSLNLVADRNGNPTSDV